MIVAGERPRNGLLADWPIDSPQLHWIALPLPSRWRGHNIWRWMQVPLMVWHLIRLTRCKSCRVVLAIFPDEAYLLAAYLAARVTGCIFIPYFHNTYLESRQGVGRVFAQWLQARVFNAARHVFVISDGMAEVFTRNYPGLKCSALPHSFNEPLDGCQVLPLSSDAPFTIGFCGNVNRSCHEAAARAFSALGSIEDIQFKICSGLPEKFFLELGLPQGRTDVQRLSRARLLETLKDCDVLLLPHGFEGGLARIEYETIFPTKTIEYLLSGRPILAHTPPGVFLTRFLRQHDCALVVDDKNPSSLLVAFERLRTDDILRQRLVHNALRTAGQFQSLRVAGMLREELKKQVLDSPITITHWSSKQQPR